MGALELVRPQQRVDQVGEQKQRGDAGNDVIHIHSLSQAFVKAQQMPKKRIPAIK
jgi:hypothetical protein